MSLASAGGGFEGQRYLLKWLVLGIAVGTVAGFGAILFARAIELATQLFLGGLVGYLPPGPLGEGEPVQRSIDRPWLLPAVTALGGLISGLIVFFLAPEATGHGTDSAIAAIHQRAGILRARVAPIKLVASAITIGSGGSGGREGPAAQISASFGSVLGQRLNLSAQDRRVLVAAGMGAGIGAIFRAPLGGAVMAAEILYVHDLEVDALIPALIASIVGASIYGAVEGFDPIFGAQPELALGHPFALVYYAILGLVCGLGGILYATSFYRVEAVFHRLKMPIWLKPALGGLLVGLLGLWVHGALHTGYGWVQIGMSNELLTLPFWLIVVLPFAKILATSLSIGSGGSAGIFGPGMVIGAMYGALVWRIGHDVLPWMPTEPAPFVIVGMMALFGSIAHAPLAVMLMVAEMTGNLSLLAPAMVAVALATALVGDRTIYTSQLPNRASSPAHRLQFSFPLLSSLLVRDAMIDLEKTIQHDSRVDALLDRTNAIPGVIVVDADGRYAGSISPQVLQSVSPTGVETTRALALMDSNALALEAGVGLDVALEQMTERSVNWAPVVDDGRPIGQLTTQRIMMTYRTALERTVRRAHALPASTILFEVRVSPHSPLAGHTIRDAGLPRDALIVSIMRDGAPIFPTADSDLQPDDIVVVAASEHSETQVRAYLEHTSEPD